MYGEKLETPLKFTQISETDKESYYQSLHGSQLVALVMDGENNLVARGFGLSWSENYQMNPVMEWGERNATEIVSGAMPPGQINVQSMYFLRLNDSMPTYKNLVERKELKVLIQIQNHEDEAINGIVLDVFEGCKIQGQQGNFNSQSLYMRNASILYRKRFTGAEYVKAVAGLKYPATIAES